MLPSALLPLPKLACLNVHASLLPRWRGAAPIQATIMAGDQETGITVMYMDEGLDTGDILLQKSIPISPDDTAGSLHARLGAIAPGLAVDLSGVVESEAERLDPDGDMIERRLDRAVGPEALGPDLE